MDQGINFNDQSCLEVRPQLPRQGRTPGAAAALTSAPCVRVADIWPLLQNDALLHALALLRDPSNSPTSHFSRDEQQQLRSLIIKCAAPAWARVRSVRGVIEYMSRGFAPPPALPPPTPHPLSPQPSKGSLLPTVRVPSGRLSYYYQPYQPSIRQYS